ncbi:MAG: TonB-dependent receptor plug domain-containing protein [Luteimonas sp.]
MAGLPARAEDGGTTGRIKELDAIVVTATATERLVERAPASVSVITGEELRLRPARDVLDAVRDAPGLNIRAVGGLGRRVVSIRGMESRHTLVLVDGERIAATDQVFGLSDLQFGWIPLDAIERVEIVRGPLSSLYGSDALGGVINIITREDTRHWRGSLRGTWGHLPGDDGGGFRQFGAYASGPLGDAFALTLNGAWQEQQPVPEPSDPRLAQREGQEQKTLRARLQWRPAEGHRLALTALGSDEDRWYGTGNAAGTLHYLQSYDFERRHVGASYQGQVGGGQLGLRAYAAMIHQRQHNTEGVEPSPEQEAGERAADGHYSLALGEDHRLTGGFEARIERLVHPSFSAGDEELDQYALFVQDEWAIAAPFDLVYGVRWDKHELFGSEFSPRLYAVWELAERWILKGGYSRGFKAPMLKHISPEYRFDGPHSFIGNPDLQPEVSDNVELSLGYSRDDYWWRLTAYRNTVEGLIDNVCIARCSQPLGRLYRYENVDDATIRGAEAEIGAELPAGFRLDASYAYSDARDASDDTRLGERPLQTGSVRLDWASPSEAWQLGLRYEYTGGQLVYPAASGAAMLYQPSYGLWNASARRRLGERASVQVGVENLTDHRVEDGGDPYNYRERGRYVYATLSLGF